MRFALTAVAAGALLMSCETVTDPSTPDLDTEVSVDTSQKLSWKRPKR